MESSALRVANNPLAALLEVLASAMDVLSAYTDEIEEEAFIETEWDGRGLLEVVVDAVPALCLVGDADRMYVVAVAAGADDATVAFGDGVQGERPPADDTVTARYRGGAGEGGRLTLSGVRLAKPFAVAVSARDGRTRVRRIC